MKPVTIRVAIACCTFIVGVIAATVWLSKPAPKLPPAPPPNSKLDISAPPTPAATPESIIYSVTFCDLARNSKRYDGKIVRTQALYVQGVDTSALADHACEAWLRPSCAATDASCEKIWERITKILTSSQSNRVRIDVVGRYTDDAVDPNPLQGGSHVHMFEILELKGAEPAKRPEG